MQQITSFIYIFYDAPTRPVGVFDDFLAIQPAQGNVSTLSYPDYAIVGGSIFPSTSSRLVMHNHGSGKETDMIPYH